MYTYGMKTKILHIITKSNWGGAQRHVFDLVTRLPQEDFEVKVILGGNGPLAERLKEKNIPVRHIENLARDISWTKDARVFFELYRLFKTEKPDIVHLHSSKIGGLGALAARLARVKRIVFTSHGWAFNEDRSFVQKIVIAGIVWITVRLSTEVIAVSESIKNDVKGWPGIKTPITVIHLGIEKEALYSKDNARLELKKLNPKLKEIPAGIPWIGTVAELHPVKGLDYALHALHGLGHKNFVYIVVGNGDKHAHLEALCAKLNLSDRVFFLGYIPQTSQYMKAFDIFLLPSISEAFGYVLLEASNARVPIVASAVGGIPEIIDDMASGILVQPKKSKELAHALNFMMEHREQARSYAEEAARSIEKKFSIESMVSKTVAVYKKS